MRSKTKLVRVAVLAALVLVLAVMGTATMAQQPEGGEIESIVCGDNITCNRTGWAARISNSGGGGVFLAEQDAYSVALKGTGRPGVFGSSGAGIGVKGTSTNSAAIWGRSTNDVGVFGRSDTGYGAQFDAESDNDLVLGGIYDDDGALLSNPTQTGSDVHIRSNDNIYLYLDDDSTVDTSEFHVYNSAEVKMLEVEEDGDVKINDDLFIAENGGDAYVYASAGTDSDLRVYASGWMDFVFDDDDSQAHSCFSIFSAGTFIEQWCDGDRNRNTGTGSQSVAVGTSAGTREMYSMGSPELWFEDFGNASLVDGKAVVSIDPLFAETVNLDTGYHVYVTPITADPVLLSVSAKTSTGFEVHGVALDGSPVSVGFDYRVVAKRAGYEHLRLDAVDLTRTPATEPAEQEQPDADES